MTIKRIEGRFLALDYGRKRIGAAVSDGLGLTAQPLDTLLWKSWPQLIDRLKEWIESYQVARIVVGLPLSMRGTRSEMTREVERFAERIENALKRNVILWDERLTSVQARRVIQGFNQKPSQNKSRIDQLAAMHILQSYLDSLDSGNEDKEDL